MIWPLNDAVMIIISWLFISITILVSSLWLSIRILKGETHYEDCRRFIIFKSKIHCQRRPLRWNDMDLFHLGYPVWQRYLFVTLYVLGIEPYRVFDFRRLVLLKKEKYRSEWWISMQSWKRKPLKKVVNSYGAMRRIHAPMFVGKRIIYVINVSFNHSVSVGDLARVTKTGRSYFVFPVIAKRKAVAVPDSQSLYSEWKVKDVADL